MCTNCKNSVPLFTRCRLLIALLLATIGLILLIIAVISDRWEQVKVDRPEPRYFQPLTINNLSPAIKPDTSLMPSSIDSNFSSPIYSHNRGLFQECYNQSFHSLDNLHLSPIIGNQQCRSYIYRYLFPSSQQLEDLSNNEASIIKTHSYIIWAMLISGALGFCLLMLSLPLDGAALCIAVNWRLILASGILLLLAAFFFMCSIGLYHLADYQRHGLNSYDLSKVDGVHVKFDWSYAIAWVGIAMLLLATILQLVSYCIAKSDIEAYNSFLIQKSYKAYHWQQTTPAEYFYNDKHGADTDVSSVNDSTLNDRSAKQKRHHHHKKKRGHHHHRRHTNQEN